MLGGHSGELGSSNRLIWADVDLIVRGRSVSCGWNGVITWGVGGWDGVNDDSLGAVNGDGRHNWRVDTGGWTVGGGVADNFGGLAAVGLCRDVRARNGA